MFCTYICMYINYCTMHAAPHPLRYKDIAAYTGLVCLALVYLALLPKPQRLISVSFLALFNLFSRCGRLCWLRDSGIWWTPGSEKLCMAFWSHVWFLRQIWRAGAMTTLRSIMVVTTTHIANFILLVVMPFVGKEPPCSERHSVTWHCRRQWKRMFQHLSWSCKDAIESLMTRSWNL